MKRKKITRNNSQESHIVPQELLKDMLEVLQDLRKFVSTAGQIRPLSIAEAAKALRCRREEIENLINRGILPVIKRNGSRYVLPADILQRLRNETEIEVKRTKTQKRKHTHPPKGDIDPCLQEFFD